MSLWKALPAALALLLAGCATVYVRPTDADPHAMIKYRRVYDQTDAQSLRESLGERLTVDDQVAYEATIHAALVRGPRIDEVRVRAELATFSSSVTFFHLARRGLGAFQVADAGCSSAVRFPPAEDASYLLELSFSEENHTCSLSCLEQVPRADGELETRACPTAPPPPPPRALPVTHIEVH